MVTILIEGSSTVHIEHFSGTYLTLCGIEDDSVNDSDIIAAVPGSKITCLDCYHLWLEAGKYQKADFVAEGGLSADYHQG